MDTSSDPAAANAAPVHLAMSASVSVAGPAAAMPSLNQRGGFVAPPPVAVAGMELPARKKAHAGKPHDGGLKRPPRDPAAASSQVKKAMAVAAPADVRLPYFTSSAMKEKFLVT